MIFFDLDDTLLDHRSAQDKAVVAWSEAVGARLVPYSQAQLPEIWRSATLRYWKLFEAGKIPFAEQRRRRIRDIVRDPNLSDQGADEMFARFVPFYEANWRLFPDVLPCLALSGDAERSLNSRGLRSHGGRCAFQCGGRRRRSCHPFHRLGLR